MFCGVKLNPLADCFACQRSSFQKGCNKNSYNRFQIQITSVPFPSTPLRIKDTFQTFSAIDMCTPGSIALTILIHPGRVYSRNWTLHNWTVDFDFESQPGKSSTYGFIFIFFRSLPCSNKELNNKIHKEYSIHRSTKTFPCAIIFFLTVLTTCC